jgi:hypothetical protein
VYSMDKLAGSKNGCMGGEQMTGWEIGWANWLRGLVGGDWREGGLVRGLGWLHSAKDGLCMYQVQQMP